MSFRGEEKKRQLHTRAKQFSEFAHKIRVLEALLPAHHDISCPVISRDFACPPESNNAADESGEEENEAGVGGTAYQGLAGTWTSGERNSFKREWYTRHTMAAGLWDAQPGQYIVAIYYIVAIRPASFVDSWFTRSQNGTNQVLSNETLSYCMRDAEACSYMDASASRMCH